MIEKVKLEIPIMLPENGECERCITRLQEALLTHKGVAKVHVDRDQEPPRLCLHYDPNLISLAQVEEAARQEGISIERRFHHELLDIEDMDCADCAQTLEKGVGRLDGVLWVAVNFATAKMRLEYHTDRIDRSAIVERIRELGYDVGVAVPGRPIPVETPSGLRGFLAFLRRRRRDTLTAISGLFILLAFSLGMAGVTTDITHAIYGLAILAGGYYVARSGIAALRTTKSLDMNFLMTVAILGAMVIGEWEEGALVVFLFSLGETLESYTLDRARNAIRSLMDLAPPEATMKQEGREKRVPVEQLKVGDIIIVRPGERVPMDGKIIKGASAVNQAPITGESVPVEKGPGHEVFAGSINGQGALEIQVTKLAKDNTLSRIIHMVEEAQAQKAPSQRFVDAFARYYTPAVVMGAVLIAAVPPLFFGQPFLSPPNGTGWLYRALVLLVIACPCALVISTPVSIVSAISNAAQKGVLIKGGAYLEEAARLKVIAFDKTGTLTRGEPAVTDVIALTPTPPAPLPLSRYRERGRGVAIRPGGRGEGLLRLAAAVESRSEHPLAQAIVREARHRSLRFTPADDFQALTGRGARARLDDRTLFIGNQELFAGHATLAPTEAEYVEHLEQEGKTVMLVGDEREVVGFIAVADQVRPEARQAVAALRRSGIARMVMLTGDNERTARAIAKQVEVDDVRAGLLPEEKVQAIETLLEQHGKVAMVGDGVNDAPALAASTVGIAMGGAGTAQALETADIALMADDLSKLPYVMALSQQTLAIIRQNIAVSLLVKGTFVGLALLGAATLWMAVFADMGTSLLVTLNGMRLLRYRWNSLRMSA